MSAANKGGRPRGSHHKYIHNQGDLDVYNRRPCECAYCPHKYESMRPEQVWTHVIDHCKNIPAEVRSAAIDDSAAKAPELQAPQPKRTRTGQLRQQESRSSSSGNSIRQFTPSAGNVTPATQKELDSLLLRAFVHAGLPFRVADNPFLVDLLQTLRPKWQVPGRTSTVHTWTDMLAACGACTAG